MEYINYKKPRQRMWGIIKSRTIATLPYGNVTDETGRILTFTSTNSYVEAQEQMHELIKEGVGVDNLQLVEFVPYDYVMQPSV